MNEEAAETNFDVILLGSGVASLTAGALLSKKGLKVLILEQHPKPGGYLHCFNRFGHRFDTGAHYVGALHDKQPFRVLLEYLNVYDQDLFVPLANEFDIFHFPEFTATMAQGYPNAVETLVKTFPQERTAIQTFFDLIREATTHFPTYEFNADTIDSANLMRVVEESLATVVNRLTQNQSLKAVFYAYCTLHGVMPEEVPFGFHAIMTDSLIRGAHGFAHGGDALAKKYVEAIRANGGKILLRHEVTKIETSEKLATGVLTSNGNRYTAKWIISGAHPKLTFELIDRPELFSPAFRERVKNTKESVGIFGVYGVASPAPDLNPLRNYHYFNSTDPAAMFGQPNLKEKPAAVFLCPSDRLPKEIDSPFALSMHAIAPYEWFAEFNGSRFGQRPAGYAEKKNEYTSRILETVEQHGTKLREQFSKFVTSSPLTNIHFNGSFEGSSYGIYHSIQNVGPRALGPRTHIANLLLTGQSTLFPGILGSAISGLRTAGHIVGIKPILKELKAFRENAS